MLTLFRKFARSWLSLVLLLFVFAGLAVFGWENYTGGGIGQNLIKAGGRALTPQDLNVKLDQELQRYQNQTEEYLSREDAVARGVFDALVGREAVRTAFLGYADRLGVNASLDVVLAEISTIEAFKDPTSGAFDNQIYRRVLDANGLTPALFRRSLTEDLTIQYLSEATDAALTTPSVLGRIAAALEGEVRTVSWFEISAGAAPDVAAPSEDDIQSTYNENLERFVTPERRAIRLLSFSPTDFAASLDISDDDLLAAYEAEKTGRFASPETRSWTEASFEDEASALKAFGALAGGGDPETVFADAFLIERASIQDEAGDGEQIASVFDAGAMVGNVFGPFARDQDFLIVRLNGITPGAPKPFEDVAEEIRTQIVAVEAERAYFDAIDSLPDRIGSGESIDQIAEALDLPIFSFAPADARGAAEGTAPFRALAQIDGGLSAAFSLDPGRISEIFEDRDSERADLLVVDEIVPPETPPIDKVRDDIIAELNRRASAEALQAAADQARANLEAGGVLDDVAAMIPARRA
ncbi:MAG: SurA N-terminal domain-containing protein, partial [Pseudomonadota bacterium]